jgi:mannan endo-1,4-beta-mannosidase
MVWRNAGVMKNTEKLHYYAPFPGHASATDFVRFIKDPMILSGNKTQALDLYRSRIK